MPSSTGWNQAVEVVQNLSSNDGEAKLKALRYVKNQIIGNKTKKMYYINLGAVPRVVQVLANEDSQAALLVQSAAVVGSFAYGIDQGVRAVLESGALPHLLRRLQNDDLQVVEASARSLKMIFQSALAPKHDMLEGQRIYLLINLLQNKNENVAAVAASVIARCCETMTQQEALLNAGAMDILIDHLESSLKLREACLDALGSLVKNNCQTCVSLVGAKQGFALSTITKLLKDKSASTRLLACICLGNISRSCPACYPQEGEIRTNMVSILVKLLEESGQVGEQAPFVLAYYVSDNEELQKVAFDVKAIENLCNCLKRDFLEAKHLEGILLALSELCSQLEESRRKVLSLGVESRLVAALGHECIDVREAACACIKSISRSVKILRTCLTDKMVIKALFKLLSDDCLSVQVAALRAVSNIVLDFTPNKTIFFNCGDVTQLIKLAKSMDSSLRVNALWALRNLIYMADITVKEKVMEELTPSMLSSLIHDPEEDVQEQALAFVRNLVHGNVESIWQFLGEDELLFKSILRRLHISKAPEVCSQGLYVLTNIAAGNVVHKDKILNSIVSTSLQEEHVPLLQFLQDTSSSNLRVAAVWCLTNICYPDSPGVDQRMERLKDTGIPQQLQQMIDDPCVDVRDRVKTVFDQIMAPGLSL
eukprot:TRINITY_DN8893_c0_g1_i1.p1 TRINITY_DN8893_c0_g1~~TRINITY_DN8893_c0_g1_i1.p1  ORF type:complete len:653 (+),score=118.01 TRINITY_DN8893_c0_g1_i1:341-2299(+)